MGLLNEACQVLTPMMIIWIIVGLLLFGILYMLLEYWLGKTEKVAPSSVLEAVGMGLKMGIGAIFNIIGRKKDDGNSGTKSGS